MNKLIKDVLQRVKDVDSLPWVPYAISGRTKTDIVRLYGGDDKEGPAAALVRYNAGARTKRHLHPGYELIFVLDGVLHNDSGTHTAGTIEICAPGSTHELWSDEGCVFLVVWEEPVKPVSD